ncbi:MAG TPA: GatB/YqeY domain-containing protein [Vicinamibacterales bacterium]|nr:GatB/YqeY domain-containing protein [Acidobacteriota bacterium]HOC16713.1 GatB/YqeY domain-containing protein [Vicinamibacterales bacterium]
MSLMQDVSAAITAAMKQRDEQRLGALRLLKAALMNREVERGRALAPDEELQVVTTLVKQRRESIEQFSRGGRQDLVDREQAELQVLQAYLPPALDDEALGRLVQEVIVETGASSPKDMGRVMKTVMARIPAGAADGKAVSERVKTELARKA